MDLKIFFITYMLTGLAMLELTTVAICIRCKWSYIEKSFMIDMVRSLRKDHRIRDLIFVLIMLVTWPITASSICMLAEKEYLESIDN